MRNAPDRGRGATASPVTSRGARMLVWVLAGALCGCASSSDEIRPQYVSPAQYASYDCQQIAAEQQRVSARVGELANEVDDNAAGDAVAVGVGLILFWPALLFVDGDGPEAAEYGRLKGEHEALLKAGIEKKCPPVSAVAVAATRPLEEGMAASGGRQILVTPTVKARIDRYVRNCEAQGNKYCVIAVRNDGSSVELGKADAMSTTRKDAARRTALNSCGGAALCTIVYEDGKTHAEVVSQ